ncbi:hypothetical protein OSB04_002814 [Centaurea solstitialis]|uniref:Transferase, Chloramphenicol acetyltransferase-like domain protein n=1 Tax=Centaurea solstitialis TaxID=347529 RepID=A0AA38TTL8_9ASTR|nr:hypothetical protein OSB04_002814 [Centaurea solstitialis]
MGYESKLTKLPSYQMRSLPLFSIHQYSTSTIPQSSYRSIKSDQHESTNNKKMDLEIISRETIKPSFPTPHRLRTFNFSMIDQIIYDCYTPLVLFLPNNNKATVNDVVTKRSKRLKETLSEILTRFYPVAGEVKDNFHIECNDKGVHFVIARVNQTLEDFLVHPDDQKVRELIPDNFGTLQSSIRNYLAGIQVNIFNCGGIGLCTSLSHKIFDGHTYFMFMKEWAAAVRGSPQTFSPNFMASEVFPNNPSLKYSMPSKLRTTKSLCTKRFLFDSKALDLLKAQLVTSITTSTSLPRHGPTRMEATTTLIWMVAAKAAFTIRPSSPQSPHVLLSIVNLRKRSSPPFPSECIGNLIVHAAGFCFPESQPDLTTLMGQIRKSIAEINSDSTESMRGEKGQEVLSGMLKTLKDMIDGMPEGDCLIATSLLNNGIYEIDFGWGKPMWFYVMNPEFCRFVALNDTIKGGGVEATVTLSFDEMEIFEHDPVILKYATINPSPLQYLHD